MKESDNPEEISTTNSTSKIETQAYNSNDINIKIPTNVKLSEFENQILEAYRKINTIPNNSENEDGETPTEGIQYIIIIKATELDLRCALKYCIQDENVEFKRFIIDKMNRISLHNFMNINYILGEIYISLMKKNNFFGGENVKKNMNDVIYFINRVVELEECIKSTEISKFYQTTLVDFLNKSIQTCDFDDEQKENLKLYIENFTEDKDFSLTGETLDEIVISLNEELGKQSNIYDQYHVFLDNKKEIEKAINDFNLGDRDSYDNVLSLGKYLAYYLYNLNFIFYLKRDEDDNEDGEENENEITIKKYYDGFPDDKNQMNIIDEEKFYIKNNDDIEKFRLELCELIIEYAEKFSGLNNVFGIQYILYVLFKRIYYYYYDIYINRIKELLVGIVISLCFFEQAPIYNLSSFINKIIKSNEEKDSELKNLFLSRIEQYKLNKSFLYKLPKKFNNNTNNINNNKDDAQGEGEEEEDEEDDDKSVVSNASEGVMLFSNKNDLKIGYLNTEEIKAGEFSEYYIELSESFCLLDFVFQIKEYDINLKITNLTEGKKIYSGEKILNKDCPIKFIMLFTNPCILKIEFDNSYSWMKPKQIQYKANVFYSKNAYSLGDNILLSKYIATIMKNKKDFEIDKSKTNGRILITKIFDEVKVFNCLNVKQNMDIIHKMMKDNYLSVSTVFIETSKNNEVKNNFYYLEENKLTAKELNKESFENYIIDSILKDSKVNLDLINLYIIRNDNNIYEEKDTIEEVLGFEPEIKINGISQKVLFFPQFLHQSQLYYYLYKNVYDQESFDIVFLINYNKYSGFQIATFIEGKIDLNYEKFKTIKNNENFEDSFEDNLEVITKEIKELSEDRNISIVVPEFFESDSDYSGELINKLKETFEQNENENNDCDNNIKIIKLDKNFNDELSSVSHIFYVG